MKINEMQSKAIYDFIVKYNSEEKFNKDIQEIYNNEPGQLSILEIYALEEVLRYGTKDIYNKFLNVKGTITEEQAVNLFDGFVRLINQDDNFKQYKMEQLENSPETLSELEIFAFELIRKPEVDKEQTCNEAIDELEYDPLNPILFSYDKQIKETLKNLFFGELIHQMLEVPSMKPIKDRQKENGRIANSDKQLIIKKIQGIICEEQAMSQLEQIIDQRYVPVKMSLLMGKGEEAFGQYLNFNTNITANEIFGIEKDIDEDDMYDYLKSVVNNRRAEGQSFTEDDAMDFINKIKQKGNEFHRR